MIIFWRCPLRSNVKMFVHGPQSHVFEFSCSWDIGLQSHNKLNSDKVSYRGTPYLKNYDLSIFGVESILCFRPLNKIFIMNVWWSMNLLYNLLCQYWIHIIIWRSPTNFNNEPTLIWIMFKKYVSNCTTGF